MLEIGSIVDNKYKILSEIGHGGMSVVYLAINERANKTWAIKEVRKDGVVDFESVKQGLVVETEMLKKLNHNNLPSIIDVIDTEDSFLIIMDYIEGTSLAAILKTAGAQPEENVVRWARQLCDVLGYLHGQNPPIIYRDMKPANVMLKPDGNVMLIDFGTAREFKNRAMVEDTTCLGTRGYAAPEQFGGRGQTDARTDIYCLGATMYHLITGHSPAEPPYEIKPISYWIPQYAGSGLEKLILKCTQQDPAERYQNCAELMYALDHYRDEDDIIQKKRKKQWRRFITAAIIGLVGLLGVAGMRIAWNGAKQASYGSLVKKAIDETEIEDAEKDLMQAIALDPGAPSAYQAMWDIVDKDRTSHEGEVTGDEIKLINDCLNSNSDGRRVNSEVYAKESPEEYAKMMYNIGLLYFFVKGGGDGDKETAHKSYFSKVIEEPYINYLTPAQQEMADMLNDIGSYIGSLDRENDKLLDNTNKANYSDLFNSIKEILSADLKEKVERDIYCIKIYEQIANWIDVKVDKFRDEGISIAEMNSVLDSVESGLKGLGIKSGSENYSDYQQATGTLEKAREILGTFGTGNN